MLRREGDNERRSKRFCPNARSCAFIAQVSRDQMVKTRVIK